MTETKTKRDWAEQVRGLVDEDFPGKRVTPVMDNLNTHCIGSLYETFPPEEARRIASWLEMVFTPKHGSWLNMAEIEIGVLSRQCLDRRIPDQETMKTEVEAWQERRNAADTKVRWRFRTDDARIGLKSLYPDIQHG